MKAVLKCVLLATGGLLPLLGRAQQPADAPPETGIREHLTAPPGGIALWEHRTAKYPARRWPAGRKLYVQTAPDTAWFRVLIFGNSYFVRQREMPVPGWRPGSK